MKRLIVVGLAAFVFSVSAIAQAAPSPLIEALESNPVQASYLARHPEILRWIGKHPHLTEEKAKNQAINEWVAAWPDLALLLSQSPEQTLAWAEDPQPLTELPKKGPK